MEVCKSDRDMISCAIEWQPSEAAFDVWPPKTERQLEARASDHILPVSPQCLIG